MKTRAGKIVWVVETGVQPEAGRAIGVFSTEALAHAFVEALPVEDDGVYNVAVLAFELDGPDPL